MTIVKLGYVAMSVNLQNASPSRTMTFSQFQKIKDREAAIRKLERIARTNLENSLRLLKHNVAHDISFFRFSSRLIPLANHPEVEEWDYLKAVEGPLAEIGNWLADHPARVDFHPDHFVLLTSRKVDVLNNTIKTLNMHHGLLKGMGISARHRCVLHVGGAYKDKEKALEVFVNNWGYVPQHLQEMIMLENDDKTFNAADTLYLCEKLGIPLVFDYHHHLAHHDDKDFTVYWERILKTWEQSDLPLKMHISSPRDEKDYREHADYIDSGMLFDFLNQVKGSVNRIDCMIEAKQKDDALFRLMEDVKKRPDVEVIDGASFKVL